MKNNMKETTISKGDLKLASRIILRNHKNSVIKNTLNLPDKFVFALWKKNSTEPPMDPWYAVSKKTMKEVEFNPMMDIENFKKAMKEEHICNLNSQNMLI